MTKKPLPTDAPPGPFNSVFSKLKDKLPDVPAGPAPAPATPRVKAEPPPPARAVVRMERKGRGGKEATVVEKLGLPPARLAEWADALKRSLGTGGGVEEDTIVVQGDQRERVARWLEGRGVRKVVRG
jgi:translation initiation factor 1